jgi:hypothetical protein
MYCDLSHWAGVIRSGVIFKPIVDAFKKRLGSLASHRAP